MNALVKRLVEKPASVINWSILWTCCSTYDEGEEIEQDYVGKVKPPFTHGGKRYWLIEYEDLEELSAVDMEELAALIDYSFQMGTKSCPPKYSTGDPQLRV
jgi:hypothetical protein